MKRIRLVLLVVSLAMVATAGAQEITMTVDVATAGTLSELIGDNNKSSVEYLIVTGTINSTDIKYLREMAGRDNYGDVVTGNRLTLLDISGADIVEGGDPYFYSYTTSNNVVGDFMFAECSQLTGLFIPESTVSLGWCAVSSCTSLTDFVIPDNVTEIGESAFEGSSSIGRIILGKNVSVIEGTAFKGCSALEEMTLPESLTKIGHYAFADCSSLTTINIPGSVEKISMFAFNACSSLVNLTISEGVKTIGENAFYECSSLESVVIPESVTTIEEAAFDDCSSLVNIQLPSQLKCISEKMLSDCSSLREITLPEALEEIGESAFLYDESLETIHVPNSVTSIGDNAFFGCTAMTEAYVGSGAEYIGDGAFQYCDGLKAIIVDAENANYASLDGLLTNKDGDELIAVPGAYATDFVVPASIKTIADGACIWNVNITSLTIHDDVESIGESAFEACESLKKMVLGSSVASIGDYAFFSCDSLEEIHCRMTTPVEIDDDQFWNLDKSACTLYVPKGSLDAYKEAAVWCDFENILEEEVTAIYGTQDTDAMTLRINGRSIAGATGQVRVTTINGTTLYDGPSKDISISNSGLYIISTDSKAFKYLVK